jgi:hypothetical protein
MKSEIGYSGKSNARKHRLGNGRHRAGEMLARIGPPQRLQQAPDRSRAAERKESEKRYNMPSLHGCTLVVDGCTLSRH